MDEAPRILVVDDDDDVRDALRDALEDAGFAVETAPNGRVALEMIRTVTTRCLVLLDLMMPETNGWEVLRVLEDQGRPDHVSVVVMTAARPERVPAGVPWLRKPFDLNTLLAEVRRQLVVVGA